VTDNGRALPRALRREQRKRRIETMAAKKTTAPRVDMTQKETQGVRNAVENEGFDYAFRHYSNFDEVKSTRFHELRNAYVAAAKTLAEFVGVDD
jgi:hypothetical protein